MGRALPAFGHFRGKNPESASAGGRMPGAKRWQLDAALQAVVQKLGKPWYLRRAVRVFRDDTSLSATPHLWPSIEQALGQSRYFILLASPEAAASKWVNKEVTYWLDQNWVADEVMKAVRERR